MANSLFKISSSHILNEFLHDCIDDLTGLKEIKFDSYSGDVEWTEKDYTQALHFTQTLYREEALNQHSTLETHTSELGNDLQEAIKACYNTRRNEIVGSVAKDLLLGYGPLVENIDWKLKWVMGSSTFSALREPLLQVDLHCFKTESSRMRISFEMTVDKVETMIKELEKAKAKLKTS